MDAHPQGRPAAEAAARGYGLEDVVDVDMRDRRLISPDLSGYIWIARFPSLLITLADGRRIRLRAHTQAEADEAWGEARRLLRG